MMTNQGFDLGFELSQQFMKITISNSEQIPENYCKGVSKYMSLFNVQKFFSGNRKSLDYLQKYLKHLQYCCHHPCIGLQQIPKSFQIEMRHSAYRLQCGSCLEAELLSSPECTMQNCPLVTQGPLIYHQMYQIRDILAEAASIEPTTEIIELITSNYDVTHQRFESIFSGPLCDLCHKHKNKWSLITGLLASFKLFVSEICQDSDETDSLSYTQQDQRLLQIEQLIKDLCHMHNVAISHPLDQNAHSCEQSSSLPLVDIQQCPTTRFCGQVSQILHQIYQRSLGGEAINEQQQDSFLADSGGWVRNQLNEALTIWQQYISLPKCSNCNHRKSQVERYYISRHFKMFKYIDQRYRSYHLQVFIVEQLYPFKQKLKRLLDWCPLKNKS